MHVCWIAAKMPLHSAKSRPQRDYAAAVSVQHVLHLPREIVETSAVHVADEPFTGTAISLLGVRLVRSVLLARWQVGSAWRTLRLLGAFPTPVGGHHSLDATFLGSYGDSLWELVSPRIHASPPT